jgi:hypothetical protein
MTQKSLAKHDNMIDLPLNFHPAAIRASVGFALLPTNWIVFG